VDVDYISVRVVLDDGTGEGDEVGGNK